MYQQIGNHAIPWLFLCINYKSGQIIATSQDLFPPKGGLVREIPSPTRGGRSKIDDTSHAEFLASLRSRFAGVFWSAGPWAFGARRVDS